MWRGQSDWCCRLARRRKPSCDLAGCHRGADADGSVRYAGVCFYCWRNLCPAEIAVCAVIGRKPEPGCANELASIEEFLDRLIALENEVQKRTLKFYIRDLILCRKLETA